MKSGLPTVPTVLELGLASCSKWWMTGKLAIADWVEYHSSYST
jgi:hypothetical protein